MRYLSVLFALVVLGASQLQAQSGMTIFKHSLTKAQIEASVKEGCPKKDFNVGCEAFLTMLRKADPANAPTTIKNLPVYIRSRVEGSCGEGNATFATAYANNRVEWNEKRSFRPAERCLKNPTTDENVMSEDCGNGAIDVFMTTRPASLGVQTAPISIKDTAATHTDIAVTFKDTLQVKVQIEGPKQGAFRPAVPVSDNPPVLKSEKKSFPTWAKATIGAVVIAAVVCAVKCRWRVEQNVTINNGSNTPKTGEPVIPPNLKALIVRQQRGWIIGASYSFP